MARNNRFSDHCRFRIRGYQCIYCGDTASADEHFPPAICSPRGLILPVCSECNNFAGTEWPFDFIKRCEHVKNKLKNKYRKALNLELNHDLSDVDYPLAMIVVQWRKVKVRIQERLAWNAITYLTNIDHNNYFVRIFADNGTFINELD